MRACESAGVEVFIPHALRRAAVDAMMRAGVDPGAARAITGHSAQTMLAFYRQATMDHKRDAIQRAELGSLSVGRVVRFPGSEVAG